jgi:16S rRNA (guanine966-N2)-methyltransferase
MRIMAGELKGLPVSFPKHIRPTQDKVRKSLFDLLKGAVKGAAFLDLFAGSGVIGIEALSREASR